MIIWFIVCLFYEALRNHRITWQIVTRVGIYFCLILILSSISLHFLPISGDEVLYTQCGKQIASLISQGFLRDFSQATCDDWKRNYFVKLAGYLFFLGGDSPFSLIGFNALIMYVASHLMIASFDPRSDLKKLYWIAPFFPPIFYLALRPSKEAVLAFLIATLCFGISQKNIFRRIAITSLAIILFWLVRWQFALAAILAVALWLIWIQFVKLSNVSKILAALCMTLLTPIGWFFFGDAVSNYLYDHHFGYSNVFHHQETSLATIYKFMIFQGGEGALHPWNLLVAHIGGFITPHPFRFIKEFMRDGYFKFHIFEEFLYVSLWFYTLLPVYFLYIHRVFIKRWKKLSDIPHYDVFNLILALLLFSLACLSLLYQTPQLFRYKVPLNIYFFIVIALFLYTNGFRKVICEIFKQKKFLFSYMALLAAYTAVYFHLAF